MIWILPVVAGLCVVLQGGWNRQLSSQWGLAATVLVNAAVFLLGAALLYASVRMAPERWPEFLRAPETTGPWMQWRAILPGLCGLAIVVAIPWGIAHLGAVRVLLVVVAAQLLAGLVWDRLVEGIPIDPWRVAGVALAILGTALVMGRSGSPSP